jgi:uncharacterized membrane protein YphA (DoxX/SURF4 family)
MSAPLTRPAAVEPAHGARPAVAPELILMCRIVIGMVFVAAGLGKLSDLQAFAREIENFDVLYPGYENTVAILLPWIEIIVGLALVLGIRARGAAWLAAGCMAVFTIGVIQAMARNLDISCGCFGTSNAMRVGMRKLIENVIFLGFAVVGSLRRSQ